MRTRQTLLWVPFALRVRVRVFAEWIVKKKKRLQNKKATDGEYRTLAYIARTPPYTLRTRYIPYGFTQRIKYMALHSVTNTFMLTL